MSLSMSGPEVVPSEELKKKYLEWIPNSEQWAGYIWPSLVMSSQSIQFITNAELGENDIVIATYPKSGTTWCSEVLSAIAHEGNTEILNTVPMEIRVPWLEFDDRILPEDSPLKVHKRPENTTSAKKKIWFTHLRPELLPKAVQEGKCKLLYVARNPKDQMVSFYHFHKMAVFLGYCKDMTWAEWFTLFCSGFVVIGSWFDHVKSYRKFTQNNPKAMFITYEDMKKGLMGHMEKFEEFVGIHLTQEKREIVVNHCSFNSMKDNKMANREGVDLFDNKVSKFMRKGIVGDWKNYFTVAQNEVFDELYAEQMKGSGIEFEFE